MIIYVLMHYTVKAWKDSRALGILVFRLRERERERASCNHYIRGSRGPRCSLNVMVKKNSQAIESQFTELSMHHHYCFAAYNNSNLMS